MADTELRGTIKLTADTDEAEKAVVSLDKNSGAAATKPASKTLEEIAGKLRTIFREIGTMSGGVFGGVIRGLDETISRIQHMIGAKGILGGIAPAVVEHIKNTLNSAIKSGMPKLPSPSSLIGGFQRANFTPGSGGLSNPTGIASILNSLGMLNMEKGTMQIPSALSGLFGGRARAATTAGVATAAGGAGAGGGGAGAAAAGAGGISGIAATLGPVGIAVAAITVAAIATAAVTVGLAVALKEVTNRILDFGRSLAAASPSMAQLFAVFDVQIMLIKRQIGESLAPAFAELIPQIIDLARQVTPLFIGAMKAIINVVTGVFEVLNQVAAQILPTLIVGLQELISAITKIIDFIRAFLPSNGPQNAKEFGRAIEEANPINRLINSVAEYFGWRKQEEAKKNSSMPMPRGMQDYMDMLNKEGSAQRNYQQQQRGQLAIPAPANVGIRAPGMRNP